MKLTIRRSWTVTEVKFEEAGQPAKVPLRKVAVVAVVQNPFAGRYVEDLTPMIEASRELGRQLAEEARVALGPHEVQSYGKGGIVGVAGEQEHANALLTTVFAEPFREAAGGGKAWISSMTKVAAAGASIDIPMNHKDDVYVRSHYDGMSLTLPGAPLPDEIAIIFCLSNRGRLNARVGGLTHEAVAARA
ncbi:amino acid synthesis family protein [Microvirga massiliensis]|uniref:amino acid synthesis family protein n=1 Tax=Microvirga massiliensis TaxID=1033741 RepID=UPI000A6E42F2|nr:amino acid synthesis family protein [Microvirga massiliensis]